MQDITFLATGVLEWFTLIWNVISPYVGKDSTIRIMDVIFLLCLAGLAYWIFKQQADEKLRLDKAQADEKLRLDKAQAEVTQLHNTWVKYRESLGFPAVEYDQSASPTQLLLAMFSDLFKAHERLTETINSKLDELDEELFDIQAKLFDRPDWSEKGLTDDVLEKSICYRLELERIQLLSRIRRLEFFVKEIVTHESNTGMMKNLKLDDRCWEPSELAKSKEAYFTDYQTILNT